jgi:hypothetical protein
MGIQERLQTVTQFFQKAATRGHELREDEEQGENHASSAGEQSRQQGGMTAEGGTAKQPSQQDRDRNA